MPDDSTRRSSGNIPRVCEHCNAAFTTLPHVVARGGGRFCSRACKDQSRRTKITVTCEACGKILLKKPSMMMARSYCSHLCFGLANRTNTETELWSKVDRSAGPDACWPWTGSTDNHGYGQISWEGRSVKAHRVAFEIANGFIDPKLQVHHACDFRLCCNPKHLSQGDHLENARQMAERKRSTAGSKSPHAKLSEADILAIRARYASGGVTHRQLAKEFGVSQGLISNVVNHLRWKHI